MLAMNNHAIIIKKIVYQNNIKTTATSFIEINCQLHNIISFQLYSVVRLYSGDFCIQTNTTTCLYKLNSYIVSVVSHIFRIK